MKKFITAFFLTCTFFSSLFAQVDLNVTVMNITNQEAISDVKVTLSNTAIGFLEEKITNTQGKITFSGLPMAGLYALSIGESEAFYESKQEGITLRSNTNASVQLGLFPKKETQLREVVIGGSSKINAINAEVSSVLSQKEIEALPLEGRDISRVLFRLPNVVQATGFYPEAPSVSINGSNGLFTNYLLDGMDNNERFLGGMKFNAPIGFVKNVNVLTNNFSSEYGNTANGVVNLTSRSGSNEKTGEVFVITRPGAVVDAPSRFTQRDLSGNQVKDGFQRYQAGFGLGGAIVPNRTFYYLNAEFTRDLKDNLLSSPDLNVNETVRGINNFSYLSAKIDQHWSRRFRSALRANVGIVNIGRQAGGLTGGVAFPSAANFQDRNSALVALTNTYLGSAFKSETNVQYSRFRWNYGRALDENSPQVTVLNPQEQTIAVLGHPGYLFDSHENTIQAQQKVTFYGKKNVLKAGLELISSDHELFGGGNPNGNYTVKLTPGQLSDLAGRRLGTNLNINDLPGEVEVLGYSVELRPQAFGTRQNIFSGYVENAYSANSKLSLTLGLRYDYDNLSKGGAAKGDLNNIAPRFSFNYKLKNQSSLRGGYGIFYDKISYAVYSDALQQNTTSEDYKKQLGELIRLGILPASTDINRITHEGNLGAFATGVPYLAGPNAADLQGQRDKAFSGERRILNPNGYQNPYTHQFSLGYQRQLDENRLFYVDLVHNRSYNLFRLRDLNAPSSYTFNNPNDVVVRTASEADLTRPVPVTNNSATINGETLTGIARTIVMSETAGEARFYGASFNLQREQGDDNYAWRVSYTLSSLRNNTEDINFRAQDNNNFGAEWGPSINDRRHVLNSSLSYFPLKGLGITLASLLQSGQPINRIPDALRFGTTDLNGDGRSFGDAYVGNSDRHPGESRNSDRLPWSNLFDLSAEYAIPFSSQKDGRLVLRADVFNLFNAENLSGYSNNATQSNQIQVGSVADGLLVRRNAAPPRQFQFGLRYAF